MGAGCPQKQAVGLLKIARERQVLIGLLVLSHAGREQAQPHAGVSHAAVALSAILPDCLIPQMSKPMGTTQLKRMLVRRSSITPAAM